jgi:hypothetical protein
VTQSGDGLDGSPDQVVGQGPWYNQAIPGKSGGAVEIRASGHGSEEGEDNITFPERRTRGPRWSLLREPEAGRVPERAGRIRRRDISDEGHVKPGGLGGDTDLAFNLGGSVGRAWLMETRLGLKPDWGGAADKVVSPRGESPRPSIAHSDGKHIRGMRRSRRMSCSDVDATAAQ